MSPRARGARAEVLVWLAILSAGCQCAPGSAPAATGETEREEPSDPPPAGLLLGATEWQIAHTVPTNEPRGALLEILHPRPGAEDEEWEAEVLLDPDAYAFHAVRAFDPPSGSRGILTLSGTPAAVTLWQGSGAERQPTVIWEERFGGAFDRMRDLAITSVDGDAEPELIVGTHDQGVIAILRREGDAWSVQRTGRTPDTFVHEVEVGDLDGDGRDEVYATPSARNRADLGPQPGTVVRWRHGEDEPTVVATFEDERHAKEILVQDVDGDGLDELYAVVEGRPGQGNAPIVHPVEIRRFDEVSGPDEGALIATFEGATMARFLVAGDVDGDGRDELVLTTLRAGVYLLRRGESAWSSERIESDSSGWEHAATLQDLDGDGADELYVAADDQGLIRRYVWRDGGVHSSVIRRRPIPRSVMTWALEPAPAWTLGAP